jgi:hypothetical protein
MLNDPQAAQYALLVMYAEDMYDALPDKTVLAPPIDARVSANWTIVGFITAVDAMADAQALGLGTRFYYGFLAYSKADHTQYVAVIRGTANPMEWIEDGEFIPKPAPTPLVGTVENGFFSIHESMWYTPIGQPAVEVLPGIALTVGNNHLTVLGHSLGSALATYLALGLTVSVPVQNPLSVCLFASPHAGDTTFVKFFDQQVPNYKVYNYSRDVVPRAPFSLGYSALPKALTFTPQDANATIENSFAGNHHCVCYAAMIDYTAATWSAMPAIDQGCAACILGPNPLPVPAAAP